MLLWSGSSVGARHNASPCPFCDGLPRGHTVKSPGVRAGLFVVALELIFFFKAPFSFQKRKLPLRTRNTTVLTKARPLAPYEGWDTPQPRKVLGAVERTASIPPLLVVGHYVIHADMQGELPSAKTEVVACRIDLLSTSTRHWCQRACLRLTTAPCSI